MRPRATWAMSLVTHSPTAVPLRCMSVYTPTGAAPFLAQRIASPCDRAWWGGIRSSQWCLPAAVCYVALAWRRSTAAPTGGMCGCSPSRQCLSVLRVPAGAWQLCSAAILAVCVCVCAAVVCPAFVGQARIGRPW